MSEIFPKFISNVEEYVFKKESIYRSIFVVNTSQECYILRTELHSRDYSTIVLDCFDNTLDYNNIDARIIIISFDKFKELIDNLTINYSTESSYNLICISFTISDNNTEDIKKYYLDATNNNINNTIIFDKNYLNLMFLKEKI